MDFEDKVIIIGSTICLMIMIWRNSYRNGSLEDRIKLIEDKINVQK